MTNQTTQQVAVVDFTNARTDMIARRKAFNEWVASPAIISRLTTFVDDGEESKARRLVACVTKQISKEPAKYLACSKASWLKALSDCAEAGLMPDGRSAYLIPYGSELNFQVGYQGMIELFYSNNCGKKIWAQTFCEEDEFAEVNGELYHSVNWKKPRGAMCGAYAIAVLNSGETVHSVLTLEDIEKIKSCSRAGSKAGTPWGDWADAMAKKTALRSLWKILPKTPQISSALEKDDEGGYDLRQSSVTAAEVHAKRQNTIDSLKNAVLSAGADDTEQEQIEEK